MGVRVRRHDAIGEGMLIKKDQLPPIQFKTEILRKSGYLSESGNFWKFMTDANNKVKNVRKDAESCTVEDEVNGDAFRCPDYLCQSRFVTEEGKEEHIARGKHVYHKQGETITDYGKHLENLFMGM